MKTKNHIFTALIWGPIFIIPFVVVLFLVAILQKEETISKNSLQTLKQSIIEKNKKRIAAKVKNTSDLIVYERSIIKQDLHKRIKQRVSDAKKIALNLYRMHHKTLSEKHLQTIIIDALRPLLWNEGESFIWILDYNGVFYLAPEYLRHLEGSSILDFKDATGREIIKEEIALCRSSGEGFLWDTFTKQPDNNPEKQYKQLAYVTAFGHYNWYFGSGEYLDTAMKKTDHLLLKKISTISSQNNEHIFIMNHKGDILLHPLDPKLEGQNIYTSNDPHMTEVVPLFEGVLKNNINGFITYEWHHPHLKKKDRKITFVQQVSGTDWIIGSGFFHSDIANMINAEQEKILGIKKENRKNILSVGTIWIILSVLFSLLLSGWIKKQFELYEKRIQSQNTDLKKLNESLEDKVRKRTLKLKEANEKLERLATVDALTQVYNRYFFMESINSEVKRFYRYHKTFSLIMFDLDYFKQINDTYGHLKGDKILIEISKLVSSSLRESDTLFRFGGEEFMLILPETVLDKAYEIADRMRLLVERYDFGLESSITISVGVVAFEDGDDVDSIVSKVDTLLYHSKDHGRNRITKMH